MKKTLRDFLEMTHDEIVDEVEQHATLMADFCWLILPDGFSVNDEKKYVCLVAHLDTVHDETNKYRAYNAKATYRKAPRVFHDKDNDVYWSPDGLGADDHAGVYACLNVFGAMQPEKKPIVLITDLEESGGIGAGQVFESFFNELHNKVSFYLELDRRGYDDCVFYNDEPQEFIDYIESFGFKDASGSFSDVATIGEDFDRCAVNLSIGFYREHSVEEYLYGAVVDATMQKVVAIIKDSMKTQKVWEHKYVKPKQRTWNFGTKRYDDIDNRWGYGWNGNSWANSHHEDDMIGRGYQYEQYNEDDVPVLVPLDLMSWLQEVKEYADESYEDRDNERHLFWCYSCDQHFGPQYQGVDTAGICPHCHGPADYDYYHDPDYDDELAKDTPPRGI